MTLRMIPELQEGTYRAKASGTLPNGKPVIVNSDGTVSVVGTTDFTFGSLDTFESGSTNNFSSSAFDNSSNKVVIAYRGSSGYGTAVVGTVDSSDNSISFGTPVVFESASTLYTATTFDSTNEKIVISYRDAGNSNRGTSVVGTVSGTSISFGTPVVFETGSTAWVSSAYDSTSSKIIIAYSDDGNADYGTAIVGTVSGTSISFGSAAVFESATTFDTHVAYDTNAEKAVIVYQDVGNTRRINAIVGTISGTSITYGSPVVVETGTNSYYPAVAYDPVSQKVIMAWRDGGNSNYGTARVGTVSGTSISVGTAVVFESARTDWVHVATGNGKTVIVYTDQANSNYFTAVEGTVTGTDISFDSPVVLASKDFSYNSLVYASDSKRFVGSGTNSTDSTGDAIVIAPTGTTLTAENYIGLSKGGAVADGSSATVDIIGTTNGEQSGLTAGESYYVQTDGTLGTTPADPEVFAGTAISATELLVKG